MVGALFDLTRGPWWGLFTALVLIGFFMKWGEKLVLVAGKARYVTEDELLVNQVKNFCWHLNIEEVKIYWSNSFVNNVYFMDSFLGKPALVIGKNVYNHFTRNELNSLIYASLLRIRSKEARNRTFVSLLFLILYSPIYIARSFFKSNRIRKMFEVFFYPAFSLKAIIYENEIEVIAFDREVGKLEGLKKDYMAALFKISQMPSFFESSVGSLVLSELSHVKNTSDNVLSNILYKQVDVKTRMKALGSQIYGH
jgi:hypothetical protein